MPGQFRDVPRPASAQGLCRCGMASLTASRPVNGGGPWGRLQRGAIPCGNVSSASNRCAGKETGGMSSKQFRINGLAFPVFWLLQNSPTRAKLARAADTGRTIRRRRGQDPTMGARRTRDTSMGIIARPLSPSGRRLRTKPTLPRSPFGGPLATRREAGWSRISVWADGVRRRNAYRRSSRANR
jgi:hypothetical protein